MILTSSSSNSNLFPTTSKEDKMSDNLYLEVLTLTITLNGESEPQFNYTKASQPATGSLVVNQATTIRYELEDSTGKGLKFVSAAFATPFDKVIDKVTVLEGGRVIELTDIDSVAGKTGFSFVLSNTDNSLMVLSPDPQIVNSGPR